MWSTAKYKHELNSLSGLQTITAQQLDVELLVHKNVMRLLEDKSAEADLLKDQIASLKARPDQIKYVVRTETKIEAGPTVTLRELPESYTFRLGNGLGVAAIANKTDHYDLMTYDLNFKGQIVMTEKKSSGSIQMNSSESPDQWIEVPVSLTVIDTQARVTFEPHIGIGITAGYPWNVSGALWSTIVHFPKGIDVGGAALLGNDHSFQAGLIPIAYNVGEPLPVLTNIWVAPVATIDLTGSPGVSILVGGKL